jgi:hypothetical protein
MRRTGLGRRARLGGAAGDPLDGLVNLFDIGIVLAVAFLVVGLGAAVNERAALDRRRLPRGARVLSAPSGAPRVSGGGEAAGSVYRLADGRLLYVPAQGSAKPPARR